MTKKILVIFLILLNVLLIPFEISRCFKYKSGNADYINIPVKNIVQNEDAAIDAVSQYVGEASADRVKSAVYNKFTGYYHVSFVSPENTTGMQFHYFVRKRNGKVLYWFGR